MLTFDKKGNAFMEAEARIPYEVALGPTWHRFFEGFRAGKIWGTRCPECGRILVPARSFCPRCFRDLEQWVEVAHEGEVICWSLTDYEFFGMPTKPPFITALIRLDGTHCGFFHLIGGVDLSDLEAVRGRIRPGTRVRAVWRERKEGCIMDIQYFAPV